MLSESRWRKVLPEFARGLPPRQETIEVRPRAQRKEGCP